MAELPSQNQERRREGEDGRRFSVNWSLRAGHRKLGVVRGQVLNVSISGMLIRVPGRYFLSDILEIEFSPAILVFIRAIVQIRREGASSNGSFEYGVVFLELPDENSTVFREHLLQLRRNEYLADFAR